MDPVFTKTLDRIDAGLERLRVDSEHQQRLATLGMMAALIAHEIKNILTPVRAYAQMALAAPGDQALVKKALERALDCGDRASGIADAILGLATGGGVASEPESKHGPSDVESAVRAAVAGLGRDLESDGISLQTFIQPGCAVAMRPVSFQHVLLNLILNAQAAMRNSGGILIISANRSPWNTSSAHGISVTVEDTGSGMDSRQLDRLFRPFHSGRGSGGGIGLGMTVCRSLVEDAGGEISVESTLRRGTRITIKLPAAESHTELRKSA